MIIMKYIILRKVFNNFYFFSNVDVVDAVVNYVLLFDG